MPLKYLSLCPIQNILRPGSSESSVQIKNMFIVATELLASICCEIHVIMWRGGQGKTWSYLVTDQNVNASRTLFEDLANLSGRDVKELSQLLRQLNSCELLQVNGVIHCRNRRNSFTQKHGRYDVCGGHAAVLWRFFNFKHSVPALTAERICFLFYLLWQRMHHAKDGKQSSNGSVYLHLLELLSFWESRWTRYFTGNGLLPESKRCHSRPKD